MESELLEYDKRQRIYKTTPKGRKALEILSQLDIFRVKIKYVP
jgi:DNA-binding MarR family transcriptional regulator